MLDVVRAIVDAHQAEIGLVILVGLFVGFVVERFPAAVIAILGACAFLFFGILDAKQLFSVFSNEAPLTIGAMFILSGALLRTGTIDAIADVIIARAKANPRTAVGEMFLGVFFASAFMNNTPVVVVMIPIILKLAKATGYSPKKLLMPLSFVCILGGTTTLIGTSTNLIVDAVSREAGLSGFNMFSITPFGICAAISGAIMLVLFSRYLLPGGDIPGIENVDRDAPFLTVLEVRRKGSAVGERLGDLSLMRRANVRPMVIRRLNRVIRHNVEDEILRVEDQIVVHISLAELLSIQNSDDFKIGLVRKGDSGPSGDAVVELTVAPRHPAIGSRLTEIPFLDKLKVRILGLSRFRDLPRTDLAAARIHAADRLVVTGNKDDILRLRENQNLFGVAETQTRAFRRDRAPVAIAALAAVVILSALGILSIAVAAILAVGAILFARCMDAEEAWGAIDGNVLVLIFAMLAVGLGLEQAGTVRLIVEQLTPILNQVPIWGVIFSVYFLSVLMTEIITNNAVAIIVTPIVITLAGDLGIAPEPLVLAVMFAASASFATPIGYQTNTLVYAAGGYRFTDFFKAGIPLTVGVGVTTCLAIILFST